MFLVCIRPIVIERCSFYVQEFYIQKELCGWVSSGVCVCSSPEMGCTYRRGGLGYGEAFYTRIRSAAHAPKPFHVLVLLSLKGIILQGFFAFCVVSLSDGV